MHLLFFLPALTALVSECVRALEPDHNDPINLKLFEISRAADRSVSGGTFDQRFGSFGQNFVDFVFPLWLSSMTGFRQNTVDEEPTVVVPLSTYANWTSQGWLMRMRGYAFRVPAFTVDRIDTLSNLLLSLAGVPIQDMNSEQIARTRNATSDIFVFPAPYEPIVPALVYPRRTYRLDYANLHADKNGDFQDHFLIPPIDEMWAGGQNIPIQSVPMTIGNAQLSPHLHYDPLLFLVPPQGLMFISDIDDVLRVVKIWRPSYAVMTLVAWPFTPWRNMDRVFYSWAQRWPTAHFHYVSVCSELFSPLYDNFLRQYYPKGSLETRPMSGLFGSRENAHRNIIQTFPERKFVLIADTSNVDLISSFPRMAKEYPQVSCLLLRNTTDTDPSNFVTIDLSEFSDLEPSRWMFFSKPDDLLNIDFMAGHCRNTTQHPVLRPESPGRRGPRSGGQRTQMQDLVPQPQSFVQSAGPAATIRNWFKLKWNCFWLGEAAGPQCKLISKSDLNMIPTD